jgi:hypothetical protein
MKEAELKSYEKMTLAEAEPLTSYASSSCY